MATYAQEPTRMDGRYTMPNEAIGEFTSDGPGNVRGYTMPGVAEKSGYMDSPSGAWTAALRQFPGGVPDPMRTQQLQQYDYRPTPLTDAPGDWWLRPNVGPGYEEQRYHTIQESVDADGWELTRGADNAKRAIPDIRRTPPPENRITQRMSPNNYMYTRPFDQRFSHSLTSDHFSMADHRRNYPIHGMHTTPTRRNTYRADPPPWDIDIVDVGNPADTGILNARLHQIDVPPGASVTGRSYRLQ